ncbi:hypothetical protein F2Q70_00015658 [Brassica cretica]|uniref:Uncharacterized protein n=1 Tax=Brassica cretica TaxID=69181 RepID=A0A8S9I671_BRACR|nr:hypothetical protein F2Q70_00015658 [Brassica cretica]
MFNTYTNSVLWPRNHHGYCSLVPERSESYRLAKPSPRCCCAASLSRCCCCSYSAPSFVKPKVSINPGFVLYGLRQSTLIQWPRRLMIGVGVGGSRCEDDLHCCDSEVYPSCGVARRNRRFRVRVSDESNECCEDDVEAMISFLSEELVDEGRNCSRVEEKRKVRYGKVDTFGRVKREGVERPQGFGRQEYRRNGLFSEHVGVLSECDGTKVVSCWISDFTSLHWVPLVVARGGCGGLVADPASCCLRFNDCAGGLDLRDVLVFQIKAPLILVYQ